jgi:magnesium transporter
MPHLRQTRPSGREIAPTANPPSNLPPKLRYARYDSQHIEQRVITSVDQLPPVTPDGPVLWVELDGLSQPELLQQLGERFALHPLALEDVLHLGQRPKIEPYSEHLFLITQMILTENGQVSREQVSLFLGPGFLLTIEEDPATDTFAAIRERLQLSRGLLRSQKSDYLCYTLLDTIIDRHFPTLEGLGDSLEALEDEVLESPDAKHIQRLHQAKRFLALLRRDIWPQREILNTLLHDETGLIRRETKVYLRDCYDHSIQIMDLIESYRDVASSLMEMYLSALSMRTNEIMRVLTVISSIFIPLTFLAGIWGMNFHSEKEGQALPWNMPELQHPWGYPLCLLFMAVIAAAQLLYFKRKKWL